MLDNTLAAVPYLAFMREAPAFDPYEAPLPPPPGSIPSESPVGVYMPPMEATDAALQAFAASPAGQDPYAADDTAALALGQKMFERHCAVCHGPDAKGHGSVVGPGRFPMNPPDLTATGRPPGYIYGIIRTGRGLMPSYGARTTHTERWAIATYVQHLQAGAGAAPTGTGAAGAVTGAPAGTGAAPADTMSAGATAPAAAGQENQ
jgi:mono/diheme cytochrome c family protein